jgi:hypothetical protein
MGVIIHRSRHAQQYVVVPNAIARNTRLSFRARGLLVMLLSLPPEWHVTTDRLAEDNPDSRTAVRDAMTELRQAGYVQLLSERGRDGCTRRHLEVFDTPQPNAGTPRLVLPAQTHVPAGRTKGQIPAVGKPAVGNTAVDVNTDPKYGPEVPEVRGDRSVASSENHRAHDGSDDHGPGDQQRSIPPALQSQGADRNARTRRKLRFLAYVARDAPGSHSGSAVPLVGGVL